jgi:hypothetical protein
VVAHGPDFGDATMMLYFAVSIAFQRAVLAARARRLGDGGAGTGRRPATSGPDRPW